MRDNNRHVSNLELKEVKIVLKRNFSGEIIRTQNGIWNQEGKRTFNVEIDQDFANVLIEDLWNVKEYKKNDEESIIFLPIEVKYNHYDNYDKQESEELKEKYNPKIYIVTNDKKCLLDESNIGILDKARIKYVNVKINPFPWIVGSKKGTKGYLNKMYVILDDEYDFTIKEDPMDAEFADLPIGELEEF